MNNLIYCTMCGQRLASEWYFEEIFYWRTYQRPSICHQCRQYFQPIQTRLRCAHCYRYLYQDSEDIHLIPHECHHQTYCQECLQWQERLPHISLHNQVLFEFNEGMKAWIHRYKYLGDYQYADIMTDILKEKIQVYHDYHWVTIPSAPQTIQNRGFKATDHLLEVCGIVPYPLLRYHGDASRQATKTRQERIHCPQVYELNHDQYNPSHRYILFDDIYTTGSTLMRAKSAIFQGMKRIDPKVTCLDMPSICLAREVL